MPTTPSFTPDAWANNDPTKPLNAARLAKLGTQYAAAMADVAADVDDETTPIGAALSSTIVSVVGGVEDIVRGDATLGRTIPPVIPDNFILIADAADSEAPTAPSSLTATLTTTGVSLSWGASVDNVAVASYKVFRDGVAIAVVYALTYQDTTAAWDTTYAYTVKAVDLAGNESPASNSVNATRGISGAPVVPMTLDGAPLVAHFRMSDMLGLVTPGADAPTLKNRVSDGADLVMFGTPTFETSGRVRPCILFDGVNDAANAAIGTYAQPTTRIIVFKMGTVANSKAIMGTRTSGSLRQTFLISADSLGYNVYAGSTRTVAVVPNKTGAHIGAVRYQGATSYTNIDGTAYTIASPGTESGDGIRLAADSSGAVRTHMEAYDVIQYAGAVTDASIASLVASLKTWYGI